MGIDRLSIFGSTARGEAREDPDVDLAAELDEERRSGVFHFAAMTERLKELLGGQVDS